MSAFNYLVDNDPLRLRDLASRMYHLLDRLVGDDRCRYDHDDYCQEHYHERPCAHEEGRALLAEVEDIEGYE